MIVTARQAWRLIPLLAILLVGLSACGPFDEQTVTIAVIAPETGPDAAIGRAIERAVDLAVRQNASLGKNYKLTVEHVDESSATFDHAMASVAGNPNVVGIVGPFSSQSAVAILPEVAQYSIATISPSAMLPGLTQADHADAEDLPFARLHPKGKPLAFFRLPQTDDTAGKVAADLAVAPTQAHGFAAQSVFVVADGTVSGKTLAAAFTQELKGKGGTIAGQQSIDVGAPDSAQSIVTAIIEANPDIVFFAGGTAAGAELRSTLSLSGAPQLAILTAGPIGDHPDWGAAVGVVPASAYTTAILAAPDLSTLTNAQRFVSAYQAAFPGQALLPQSALAYDAAMDEISAIKSLHTAGKTITRTAVLAAVAAAKYAGVTGTIAFDDNGDNTAAMGFSLYSCDFKGEWHYLAGLSG